eukprot:184812_1
MEEQPESNLYVHGLPPYVSDSMLEALFCGFGKVVRHAVKRFPNGMSKSFGFVQFETEEAAQKAISVLNEKVIDESTLTVRIAMNKSKSKDMVNLYIQHLPEQYTAEDLFNLFRTYGTIVSHKILTDPSGLCTGVGFVRFMSQPEGEAAILALDGTCPSEIFPADRPISVTKARKKERAEQDDTVGYGPKRRGGQSGPGRASPYPVGPEAGGYAMDIEQDQAVDNANVYCANIPSSWSKADLEKLFSAYGEISSSRIMMHKETHESRGIGFVKFARAADARTSISGLNGSEVEGKNLTVKIASAGPKARGAGPRIQPSYGGSSFYDAGPPPQRFENGYAPPGPRDGYVPSSLRDGYSPAGPRDGYAPAGPRDGYVPMDESSYSPVPKRGPPRGEGGYSRVTRGRGGRPPATRSRPGYGPPPRASTNAPAPLAGRRSYEEFASSEQRDFAYSRGYAPATATAPRRSQGGYSQGGYAQAPSY